MKSTQEVLNSHLKFFADGNVLGLLSDYAADAVFFTQQGALHGVNAIRPMFEAMIAEFAKPGAAFKLIHQFVDRGYGYILWKAETADNVYELATDTIVVNNGKIEAQSFTAVITRKT